MFSYFLRGKLYYHYAIYDEFLLFFKYADYIGNDILHKTSDIMPENFNSVKEFLIKDGMIVSEKYGIRITEKGKVKIAGGGYKRQLLKTRIVFISTIISTICAILGLSLMFYLK